MPRAFTDTETTLIRERLVAAATRSFARRGLRRTTVDELAQAAGISKGAFYRFFDSKEALFVRLLDDYEADTHARIESAVREDPDRGLGVVVDWALHAIEDNPLLPVAMSEEGLRALRSRTPAEQQAALDRDVELVRRVLALLGPAGTRGLSEPVLLGLLRSLVFVGMHRDDIGADLVDAVSTWVKASLSESRPSA